MLANVKYFETLVKYPPLKQWYFHSCSKLHNLLYCWTDLNHEHTKSIQLISTVRGEISVRKTGCSVCVCVCVCVCLIFLPVPISGFAFSNLSPLYVRFASFLWSKPCKTRINYKIIQGSQSTCTCKTTQIGFKIWTEQASEFNACWHGFGTDEWFLEHFLSFVVLSMAKWSVTVRPAISVYPRLLDRVLREAIKRFCTQHEVDCINDFWAKISHVCCNSKLARLFQTPPC